jgi:IBR domain, a half RING-finger domain
MPRSKMHYPAHLSLTDTQYILRGDPQTFRRYAHAANMTRLESEVRDESSDTRRCPAEHCNYIFVFTPGGGAEGCFFKCPDCKASFCLQCGANDGNVGPAHEGMTCGERKKQLKQEAKERKEFEAWKKDNSQADKRFRDLLAKERKNGWTMPCPKCHTPITKNGGCIHMNCTVCKTAFNWNGKNRKGL